MTCSFRDLRPSRPRARWIALPLLVLANAFTGGCRSSAAPVRLERAFLVLPAGSAHAVLYFTARNQGNAADTITGIELDAAGRTSMHDERLERMPMGGMTMDSMPVGDMMMTPVSFVPIAAGGEVRFAPGGLHGMVERFNRRLARGDTLRLTMRLAHAAPVSASVLVISYADVDTAVAPSSRR